MDRPLRIGLVTPLYELTGSSRSGIAKHYRHLADALVARGHSVTVIFVPDFYTEPPAACDRIEANGVRVLCRPVSLSPAWERLLAARTLQRKLVHNLLSIAQVTRILMKITPSLDVIEATSFDALALGCGFTASAPALVTRISTTTEQISTAFQQFRSRAQSAVNALERAAIFRSPALLTHTRQHAKNIETGLRLATGSFAIVPHGISDQPRPEQLPEAWPHGPTVLFAGQFTERKAIDVVLAAAPVFLNDRTDARLVIAGGPWHDGPVSRKIASLRSIFGERLATVRDPDDATLAVWMYACDVFTAPSRYESFGLIYLEAMRAGKPVVATRTGGIPEVVADGETGLLVPPGDISALATAWTRLCADPALAHSQGEAGRRRFLAHFTADEMARRSVALYRGISTQTVV
ncbi:MAG: glycosyltransferase family 4 protein [Opitutaceae bacterium]|jgi:hypothetical protein